MWAGLADGPVDAVAAALDRLAPLAQSVVDPSLAAALRDAADRFAGDQLPTDTAGAG